MNKCTHCGASFKRSAAAFCPECKKPIKSSQPGSPKARNPKQPAVKPANHRTPQAKKSVPQTQTQKAAPTRKPQPRKEPPQKKKNSWFPIRLKPRKKKISEIEQIPVINLMDEDYDGYYDDTPTEDNGQNKEGLDPELIKRIVVISAGAIIVIVLAFTLMLFLA